MFEDLIVLHAKFNSDTKSFKGTCEKLMTLYNLKRYFNNQDYMLRTNQDIEHIYLT